VTALADRSCEQKDSITRTDKRMKKEKSQGTGQTGKDHGSTVKR